MKTLLLCFAFLLPAIIAPAQDTTIHNRGLALFWEPSSMFSVYNGSIATFGLEKSLGEAFALNGSIGAYIAGNGNTIRPHGYKIKAAIKAYLPEDQGLRTYLALEYCYKDVHYTYEDEMESTRETVQYHVQKYKTRVSLLYGAVIPMHKIFLDGFVGAGIGYKYVSNDINPDQLNDFYHWHEGFIQSFSDGATACATFDICLGVRVGLRFFNKHHKDDEDYGYYNYDY
ncbi:hypothetical protein ACTHGU_09920 [Chitinophagaceae bacterium MMS25-I14]